MIGTTQLFLPRYPNLAFAIQVLFYWDGRETLHEMLVNINLGGNKITSVVILMQRVSLENVSMICCFILFVIFNHKTTDSSLSLYQLTPLFCRWKRCHDLIQFFLQWKIRSDLTQLISSILIPVRIFLSNLCWFIAENLIAFCCRFWIFCPAFIISRKLKNWRKFHGRQPSGILCGINVTNLHSAFAFCFR